MGVDKNDFFREVTVRICSSLDIETALWRCLQYLETVIPVSGMHLNMFEQGLSAMRTIAQVTRYEVERLDRRIIVPEEIRDNLRELLIGLRDVMIINRPDLNPVSRKLSQLIRKPNISLLVMALEVEEKRLGSLAVYADGKNRYTKEHAQLLCSLHDPLAIAMSNALRHQKVLHRENIQADDIRYLHRELIRISGDEIIGKDTGLRGVMEMTRQIAPLKSPVLLMGETGVGKEVIANAIHYTSPRKHGPFIKVNCGAIPETLVDSELFGHEKGAFTGAIVRKRGRFERAHQGTILLDEIGELPLEAQVRLLRVLQDGTIERVGGTKSLIVDSRVIAASHQDLEEMVELKQFRKDLWFRLNVFPINIPSLRERKQDIPSLAHYFVERKSSERNLQRPSSIAPGPVDRLKDYDWPGNVRELENVVERALIRYQGLNMGGPLILDDIVRSRSEHEMLRSSAGYGGPLKLDEAMSLHIQRILELTKGKIHGPGGAAEVLAINPSTLRFRMRKLGITKNENNRSS